MNADLKTIIDKTMELEGLLMLARSRRESGIDDSLRRLILDKQAEVSRLIDDCFSAAGEQHSDMFAGEPLPEPVEDFSEEPVPVAQLVEDDDDDDVLVDEEEIDDDDEADDDVELLDEEESALTLDEALQRSMSRDLRKAFSLNDRFRFRRELFGNSDVEMNDALNLVETMGSLAEAEDFFYGDKEWDRESPEVKDFMEVIKKHFLSVRS